MDKKEHKERHQKLHKALDELIADWLSHQSLGSNKRFSNTFIMELVKWSFEQTKNPIEHHEEKKET